jgi:hypothetical protein
MPQLSSNRVLQAVRGADRSLQVIRLAAADARYRTHGHIVLLTLNDDEYCLHRMHEE